MSDPVPAITSIALEVARLLPHNAPLPWRAGDMQGPAEAGLVWDALGRVVLCVADPSDVRSYEAAGCIARAVVLAVNAMSGVEPAGILKL